MCVSFQGGGAAICKMQRPSCSLHIPEMEIGKYTVEPVLMCGGIGVSRAGCRFERRVWTGQERGMRGRQGSSARNLGRRSLPLSNSRAGTCQTKAEIRLALRLASDASVRVARARQGRLPLANGFEELTPTARMGTIRKQHGARGYIPCRGWREANFCPARPRFASSSPPEEAGGEQPAIRIQPWRQGKTGSCNR